MGHIVRLDGRKQFAAAIRVLNELPGTWHSRGTEEFTELLLLDAHYNALVDAGVIPSNGKKEKRSGKKNASHKKNQALKKDVRLS